MTFRGSALVARTVIGALLTLRVLAFADPPDPLWIGGFWDDDDNEDAVILITWTSDIVESDPRVYPRPVLIAAAVVASPDESPGPTRVPNSHRPRDPPDA